MTFEELQAIFDSKDIEVSELEGTVLDNASYYGRIFAVSYTHLDVYKRQILTYISDNVNTPDTIS